MKPELSSFVGRLSWTPTDKELKIIQRILSQCGCGANPLFAKYSFDIICWAFNTFKLKGLDLKTLIKFQKKIPTVYPWTLLYDTLRQDVNRRFNIFPLMIVLVRNDAEVAFALKFAQKYKIHICTRSGAHSYEGYSLCDEMIIDQRERTQVCLNLSKSLVTIESGVLLGPLINQLFKYKRVLQSGDCSNNGAAGLTLGGGIGFLTRKYGVTSDSLKELTVVLANGEIVKANPNCNENLYWASRGGGGGNFGIVTSFTFDVHPVDNVVIFELTYLFEYLKQLLDIYQRWAPFTVDELTAELNVFSPASPEFSQNLCIKNCFGVPKMEIGGSSERHFIITGLYLGTQEELVKLLEPVTSVGTPLIDIRTISYLEAAKVFSGKAHRLPFFKGKSAYFENLMPLEALQIIENYMLIAPLDSKLELDAQGGAVNRIAADATAYVHRNTLMWSQFHTMWIHQNEEPARLKWITDFYEAMRPYFPEVAYAYVNIVDRELVDYMNAYYGFNSQRLIETKQQYDPTNVFHFEQSIPNA